MRQYELDYYISTNSSDEIQHHGVLGQKWGIRRYQNADGSLTSEGREHYAKHTKFAESRGQKWGKALRNKSGYRNAIMAHKLYSATKGLAPGTLDWSTPRRRMGAMRKAAFVKGMYEGATGKKMAAEKYRELQDSLSKEHRSNVRRDLVNAALGVTYAGGLFAFAGGAATANPALMAAGQAVATGSAAAYGANTLAKSVGRGIRAGTRTYELNKDIQKAQGRKKAR